MPETDKNQDSLTETDRLKVKEVFAGAVHVVPADQPQYIYKMCQGNKATIDEVESLLLAYRNAEQFLESPAIDEVADTIAENHSILKEGDLLKNYKIIRRIGVGGMGEVYLAEDNKLDRKVAIKVLGGSPEKDRLDQKRFLREAKIASGLNHPNIMTVHEVGTSEETHFIVCEYIEGRILTAFIHENDPPLVEVLDLLIQVVRALSVAHNLGIIHRDIKPENIMVRDDGLAKILDFGLAKIAPAGDAEFDLGGRSQDALSTQKGLILGTIAYMSPEQARAKRVDARSDLWSFGVILFQLMTGKLPFSEDTTSDLLASLLTRDPPKLSEFISGFPYELEKIIDRCLKRDSDERYPKAEDLLRDLEKLRQNLKTTKIGQLTLNQLSLDHSKAKKTDQNETIPTDEPGNSLFVRISSLSSVKSWLSRPGSMLILLVFSGLFIFFGYGLLIPQANLSFESYKLVAPDGAAADTFGLSVATSGDTIVIGSQADDDNGMSSGSAYVFVKTGDEWVFQQKLKPLDGKAFSNFGTSVDISGETIIVGAGLSDNPGFNEGAAYVFVRNGTKWTQQQKLVPSDPAIGVQFGQRLALDGDTVVISAIAHGAYVFVRSGNIWSEHKKLSPSDNPLGENDQFGRSIDISGDTIIVGAHQDNIADSSNQGSAYIFVKIGATWVEQQKLTASGGKTGDIFGYSVAISGNSVIVGTPHCDVGNKIDQGSAYVFVRRGSTWVQQNQLIAHDGAAGDKFGGSVAIKGEIAVFGAYQDDVGKHPDQGSVYVFKKNSEGGNNWSEVDKLLASDGGANDSFGLESIAIRDNTIIVGAYQNDVDGNINQGSAYVFSVLGKRKPRPLHAAQKNSLPLVNPGKNRRVKPTGPGWAKVTLDGSGSSDPDDDPLTYSWSGPFENFAGKSRENVTIPLGLHEITLTVEDSNGGVSSDIVTINVRYEFAGFFDPIDNIEFNLAKAGGGVLFEFTLKGNYGLKIVDSGYPVSNQVQCRGKLVDSKPILSPTSGNNSLSYDASTDRYRFLWKTDKKWADTCRLFAIRLNDGSTHTAYFRFS